MFACPKCGSLTGIMYKPESGYVLYGENKYMCRNCWNKDFGAYQRAMSEIMVKCQVYYGVSEEFELHGGNILGIGSSDQDAIASCERLHALGHHSWQDDHW